MVMRISTAAVLGIVLDDRAARERMDYVVVSEGLLRHLLLSVLSDPNGPGPDLFDKPAPDRCQVRGVVFIHVDGPT